MDYILNRLILSDDAKRRKVVEKLTNSIQSRLKLPSVFDISPIREEANLTTSETDIANNNSLSLSPNNKDLSALYKSTTKSDMRVDDKKHSDPQLVKVHLSHTVSSQKVSYIDIKAQNKKSTENPELSTEDTNNKAQNKKSSTKNLSTEDRNKRRGITQDLVKTWHEIRTAGDKKNCRERLNSIYHSLPFDEKRCQNLSEGKGSRGEFQEKSELEVSDNGKSQTMAPSSLEKAPLSPKNKEVDDKFVINLYESRLRRNQSFRKSRLKIYQKGSSAQSPASTLFKKTGHGHEVSGVKSPASKLDCTEDDTQHYVTAIDLPASEESRVGTTEEEGSVFFRETHLLCSTRDFGKGEGHNSVVQSNDTQVTLNLTRTIDEADGKKKDHIDDTYFTLMKEANVRCHFMRQASGALQTCPKNKTEFLNAQIEAERVLLLSGYQYEQTVKEIRKNQFEPKSPTPKIDSGRVKLEKIEFPVKEEEYLSPDCKMWFVCVCSSGLQVLSTKVVPHRASFDEVLEFENLSSDFVIDVNVYVIKMKESVVGCMSKASCFFRQNVGTLCRGKPRRIPHRDVYSYTMMESEIMCPAFTKCGSLQLTASNINSNKNIRFTTLTPNTPLAGHLRVQISGELETIAKNLSGFVTIGKHHNGRLYWNREWCRVEGSKLMFWGSPSEEIVNLPKWSLDLRNCRSEKIDVADRNVCVRPRTILLETLQPVQPDVSVLYFLSADSIGEMEIWKDTLNAVVGSLAGWKQMKFAPDQKDHYSMV